jgi:hypothetical protein
MSEALKRKVATLRLVVEQAEAPTVVQDWPIVHWAEGTVNYPGIDEWCRTHGADYSELCRRIRKAVGWPDMPPGQAGFLNIPYTPGYPPRFDEEGTPYGYGPPVFSSPEVEARLTPAEWARRYELNQQIGHTRAELDELFRLNDWAAARPWTKRPKDPTQ